jgi:hypothetical protein
MPGNSDKTVEQFQSLLTGIVLECAAKFLLLNFVYIYALILRTSYETDIGPTNCRFAE